MRQVARNYLCGPTTAIEHVAQLRSLILVSNYLSCDVIHQLENNTVLGDGQFYDPRAYRILRQALILEDSYPFVNPYYSVQQKIYPSVVMAFTGNAAMTTAASVLGQKDAGQVLAQDEVVMSHFIYRALLDD